MVLRNVLFQLASSYDSIAVTLGTRVYFHIISQEGMYLPPLDTKTPSNICFMLYFFRRLFARRRRIRCVDGKCKRKHLFEETQYAFYEQLQILGF